jgi:hypothetical protein
MSQERRQYPRANVNLAIRTGDGTEEIRAVDLSAAGVAFESPRWIEPFTKLEVVFAFPRDESPTGDEHLVRVDAVVIRTTPESPTGTEDIYRIGCCFTWIRDEDKGFIAAYVDAVLAREAAEA